MKLATLFFVLSLVGSAFSWGGYKINFEHHDLEFDESIVNVDISMKRKNDQTVINVRGELLENIEDDIYAQFSTYEKDSEGIYKHLVNASINSCNILARVKSHPILRLIVKELLKSSNFPMACPIKRGLYYMKDFILNEDILPPFIPLGSFMSIVRIIRMVDNVPNTIVSVRIMTEIDYPKERKSRFF
ncbi:uncharacterized protein [Chironomus tepperi]|uniref:uncharacterized protein n=1 Tax=Chironomus tepperi TaxID=113505 RepID=UPI00391F26F7